MLKKRIALNLGDLALCAGVPAAVFLLTQAITAAVVAFARDLDEVLLLSGMILPIVGGVLLIATATAQTAVDFELALRFGRTRRGAMLFTFGVIVFESAATALVLLTLTALEQAAMPTVWSALCGRAVRTDALSLPLWAFLPAALACSALGVVFGALIQRFGRRAGWLIWALAMAASFGSQLFPWNHEIVACLIPLAAAAAAVGLTWSAWSLLHAVVRA